MSSLIDVHFVEKFKQFIFFSLLVLQLIFATMPLDSEKVAQVVALINDGRSQYYVANFLNVPRTTVQRVYYRYVETGGYNRRPGSGRPRCTTILLCRH